VAVGTANVVPPVFAAPEVIVLFFTCMTGETRFRNCLGRFVLERNDLRRITFLYVRLAGTVARFATRNFSLPALYV
jgi:hypothetical protein